MADWLTPRMRTTCASDSVTPVAWPLRPPVRASASCFLCELCGASLPPVREPPSFHTRRKHHGDHNPSKRPATTLRCGSIKATIWQNGSEKSPFFATTLSRPFKNQTGAWRNETSFGLNDLEALMNVAFGTKEWMTAHTLSR